MFEINVFLSLLWLVRQNINHIFYGTVKLF